MNSTFTHLEFVPIDSYARRDGFHWEIPELGHSQTLKHPEFEAVVTHQAQSLEIQASGQSSFSWGDLRLRQGAIPLGLPFSAGPYEVRFVSLNDEAHPVTPPMPPQVPHWLAKSIEGVEVLWFAHRVAGTPLNVYVGGETGVGKEVIARLIHEWSDRNPGPFVTLNCGAIASGLAESELFGHVKGAFTGAESSRMGALQQAHRGTLFLDEIGDLSLDLQVKLLRFLENGEIRPVGSDRTSHAEVRVVCATHKKLEDKLHDGTFRTDLYFRLASLKVEIPPLRERPIDIEFLSARFSRDLGKVLDPAARRRLRAYPWPGNVRELKHAIERAAGMSEAIRDILTERDFDFLVKQTLAHFQVRAREAADSPTGGPEISGSPAGLSIAHMERHLLVEALRSTSGNRKEAAKLLGVGRSTIFEMLKRHRIRREERYHVA